MSETLTIGKRAFASAVAAATILWSVGFAAFVAPLSASAASAGDVVRGTTLSTVYYYSVDGNRYAFPNEKTYTSWYSDFSGVVTMSDAELAAIPLGGNVVYRPGSRWIKIQSDPKTYAVTPEGVIRWIETEEVAQGLAGASWNTFIDDVADVFFVDYTVGPSLTSASAGYNGALVQGSTYLLWGGAKRLVSDAGFSANRFQSRFILSGAGIDLASITAGAELTAREAALVDPSQKGGVTTAPTGGLSVSVASDTPASATIPASAASVPFSKFKFTANSGTASVSQLVAHLGGVGAVGNLSGTYLYEGNRRLTDSRSVNSQTRNSTFSGLGLDFASGQTRYISVRADIAASPGAGDTASFGLDNASSIVSTATVSGSFPAYGNAMTFGNVTAGTVTVGKGGSVSNPTIGQDDAIIGRLSLNANSEDATMESLTLNIDDAKDHSDYKLWHNATMIASGTDIGSDLVQFDLNNWLIEEGNTKQLKVTADIGGQSSDNIKVAVETAADVLAKGSDFGFNLGATISAYDETGGNCANSSDDCTFSTIEGGELTLAFNGPVSDDIQIDAEDQVLMNFTLTSQNWVEIKSLNIVLNCTSGGDCDADVNDAGGFLASAVANFSDTNIRRADGSTWMGPVEFSTAAAGDLAQTLTFSDNQVLNAGDSLDLMITLDTETTAVADTTLTATIDVSTIDAEDANGDALSTSTDIVPSADIVGNTFTLTANSLAFAVSSPPSSGTFVKGASNVDVVGFNFTAGDAGDVLVTDLDITVVGDSDGTVGENDIDESDHISSCALYDSESGALIDGPEGLNSSDVVQFQNFQWSVPAGETKKAIVRCNLANVALDTTDGGNDIYLFKINATTDVVAEDESGDSVTVSQGNGSDPDNSTGAIAITVAASGSLTIESDGSTPKSTLLLGNSTGLHVATYKFSASNENFRVKELTLRNCVTLAHDTDDDCADSGETAGSDNVSSLVKLEYQDQAGVTKTKTGFLAGNRVDFTDLTFFVNTSGTHQVKVYIDTNSVSSTTATSGAALQLNLSYEEGGTSSRFDAVGLSSGTSIALATQDDGGGALGANDGYHLGKKMILRKTKPLISLANGSPSGAGVPGLSEVFRFNVAADSRGTVEFKEVTFKVTSTDNSGNNWNQCDTDAADAVNLADATEWEFYDAADPGTKLDDATDWAFYGSDGTTCNTTARDLGYVLLNFEGSSTTGTEEIGAGEVRTYVLRVETTFASAANDDSIRIDIPDQTELCDNPNNVGTNDADCDDAGDGTDLGADDVDDPAFEWDDDNEGSNATGHLLKNLPVVGGTIVY